MFYDSENDDRYPYREVIFRINIKDSYTCLFYHSLHEDGSHFEFVFRSIPYVGIKLYVIFTVLGLTIILFFLSIYKLLNKIVDPLGKKSRTVVKW